LTVLSLLFPFPAAAHQRLRPKAFEGGLSLSRAPRVGGDATLTLSIGSNLSEAVKANILFRLPRGIRPQSQASFEGAYLPPHASRQYYSVLIRVDKPGDYPLQASIYATLSSGRTVIQHFFTYLQTTRTDVEVGAEPFDSQVDNLFLQTQVKFRVFGVNTDGATVRGSIRYFDDNALTAPPIVRPQVVLYLEGGVEVASTFADERGEYIFEGLAWPPENRRDVYALVRLENEVLSLTDRRNIVYELRSETVRDIPDGETTIDLLLDDQDANRGLGAIFNAIQRAHQFLLEQAGWQRDRPVQVVWPGVGSVSFYLPSQFNGQVESETIIIAGGEDQWRPIAMYHEYGHAVMTAVYDYNYDAVPRGGYRGAHRLETVSDPGFAFNEGWAEFMEAAVDNRALNVTGLINQEVPNIESNAWWTGRADGGGANTSGENVEGAVASILWDIFDAADAIDHQPGIDDDGIANQFRLFWEIFTNDNPQNITDVAKAWREREFPDLKALEDIYTTHHALFGANAPPTFRFISPATDVLASDFFEVAWEAEDPDGDAVTVDLFYDHDRESGAATLIQTGIPSEISRFVWNTGRIEEGKYYLRALAADSRNGRIEMYSDGAVIIDRTPLSPPIVASETHPDSDRWYASNSVQLDLRTEPEQMLLRQYSYVLDRAPEKTPDDKPDPLARNNKLAFSGLSDGVWWVHVRARDALGYWTETGHFSFKIDGTSPPQVANLRWETTQTPSELALVWDRVEDASGVYAYHIQISVDSSNFQSNLLFDGTVGGDVGRYTVTGQPDATYYARIKAENGANLLSLDWSPVSLGTLIPETPPYDVNHDGVVNLIDLVLVGGQFGQKIANPTTPNPDVNRDGVVDLLDLVLVASHFGENINVAPMIRAIVEAQMDNAPDIIASEMNRIVRETKLLPNYPNPFNPETWIPYQLAEPADVKIEIYAADGRLMRLLDMGLQAPGRYVHKSQAAYWDGRSQTGELVSSGVYFYRLRAGNRSDVRKMVIIR
jgi:hypothetical protein